MKKSFLTMLLLALCVIAFADNTKTTLKKATVYFSGAELTHTANVNLTQGENEITLEGLTPNIDINSLKINVNNSVMVASSEFTNDYLTEKKSSDYVKKLQDSIDFCNAEIQKLQTAIKINTASLDLLKKGIETNVGGSVEGGNLLVKKGLSVAELTQNLDFYSTKASALEDLIAADTKLKNDITKTLSRLQNQIQQEQTKKGVYNGLLKLNLVATYATNAIVTVSYFTLSASWTPFYDMVIDDISKPVKIKGKSKVSQKTGIDWDKVNITLSTATPSKTKDAPVFSTWFLNFTQNIIYRQESSVNSVSYNTTTMKKTVQMEETTVKGKAYSGQAYSSTPPPPPPIYIVDGIEFFGDIYKLDPNSIQSKTVLDASEATYAYGDRAKGGAVVIITKQMFDYVTTEEKNSSMEYKIDLPYSIPGNGKEQIIELKNYELSAEYKYYCAPKLDENVFLIADFKDWEKLNILSGMANITYDGTFVGQTFLNTAQTNQVLSVTLGTDKRVSVKREKLTDFSKVKTLSSNTEVTLAYKITVKNNQNKPVKFTLKEQYPVSSQKDIKVELLDKETTAPTFNKEETGVLTWDFDLPVGASKEFKIAYTVKFPKDKKINLK